jgi:Protein of unknown function (DUF2950)
MAVADTDSTFWSCVQGPYTRRNSNMRTNLIFNTNGSQNLGRRVVINLAATLILSLAQPALAQTQQQTTFASAEQASKALYEAVRNKDDQAVQSILGAAPELASTGNDDQDKLERERFAQKYKEMHRLVREPDGFTVLYIGAENWPFPIPLIFSGKWRFDSDSGAQEVLAREVGENESAAIEVCHTIGSVQDGNTSASDNPVVKFARNVSQSEGAERSGELFHGYYFRVLKRNARDAVVVAYPAEYRSSGVMTFVVSKNAAYERDLGPQTAAIAQKLQGKPSGKWSRVE